MHAKQFATSNQEKTHAPHQLGHESKYIKFHLVLLLGKNSDVAKKS